MISDEWMNRMFCGDYSGLGFGTSDDQLSKLGDALGDARPDYMDDEYDDLCEDW